MHPVYPPKVILASTSHYRKELLDKLKIPFEQLDPDYEECDQPGESPLQKASRSALGKAQSIITANKVDPTFVVIASDQVAHMDDMRFGKPGHAEEASRQLAVCSDNWVSFTTAICLINDSGRIKQAIESFKVLFRPLEQEEIETYLDIDQPFDCAGSIKAESLGISLLQDCHGRDINTLYGLPLMLLQETLAQLGWPLSTLR